MKPYQARAVTIAMIVLAVILPVGAWAGGELADDDHHDEGDTTKGPYGFVKDTRGSPIPEATVTVDIKNRGQLVTQTNILGAYKIPAFGIEIKVGRRGDQLQEGWLQTDQRCAPGRAERSKRRL